MPLNLPYHIMLSKVPKTMEKQYIDCVRFLSSWRAGDYPGSFDNLHRYFDYTMQHRDR